MKEFILEALPWIVIGICIAIICANWNKKTKKIRKKNSNIRAILQKCKIAFINYMI